MPKQKRKPAKVDELTNYLITESTRETGKADPRLKAEIALLLAEKGKTGKAPNKSAKKTAAAKKTNKRK